MDLRIIHESPVEESTELVDPGDAQERELTHLGQRLFHRGDEAFFLVKIDENVHLVAGPHLGLDIAARHEYFSRLASVDIGAVVGESCDGKVVPAA